MLEPTPSHLVTCPLLDCLRLSLAASLSPLIFLCLCLSLLPYVYHSHSLSFSVSLPSAVSYCFLVPQRDCQTDPLEAPPWTPGVLAHLVPSYGTHTDQKVESLRYIMGRTAIRTGRRPPPPGTRAGPCCTCGRSVMGGRSAWSQRAEAVPITVAIDALAGRMVERDRVDQQVKMARAQEQPTVPAHMSITGMRPRLGSAIPRANLCCRPRLF